MTFRGPSNGASFHVQSGPRFFQEVPMPAARFYVTTPIPYVNARPHLGFALELVQADALARYRRLRGDDVRFLTGTDENSLSHQDFIRTATDRRHLAGAHAFWRACVRRGDVYTQHYRGLYCVGCEAFYD